MTHFVPVQESHRVGVVLLDQHYSVAVDFCVVLTKRYRIREGNTKPKALGCLVNRPSLVLVQLTCGIVIHQQAGLARSQLGDQVAFGLCGSCLGVTQFVRLRRPRGQRKPRCLCGLLFPFGSLL